MVETIFSIKGKKKSADVVFVDPRDCVFRTWWNIPAYFVTTSEGEFFSCPAEENCIEKAREEEGGHCFPIHPCCGGCLFETFCLRLYIDSNPSEKGMKE